MRRAFFALRPDAAGRKALQALQQALARTGEHGLDWLASDDLHLTLAFLGDLDAGQTQVALAACASANPAGQDVELAVDRLDAWPASSPHCRVLSLHSAPLVERWAGQLRGLRLGTVSATGRHAFVPHITLARGRPALGLATTMVLPATIRLSGPELLAKDESGAWRYRRIGPSSAASA